MPQNLMNDKSPVVQVMAWCLEAVLTQIYVTVELLRMGYGLHLNLKMDMDLVSLGHNELSKYICIVCELHWRA